MAYDPLPAAFHLARGYCCKHGCQLCPYGFKPEPELDSKPITHKYIPPDRRLIEYIKRSVAGEVLTFYSDRKSLVASIKLGENLTIVYRRVDESS
jgi:hypothetical protein